MFQSPHTHLCEAKLDLTPELIGQALVYKQFTIHAGAIIKECVVAGAKARVFAAILWQ